MSEATSQVEVQIITFFIFPRTESTKKLGMFQFEVQFIRYVQVLQSLKTQSIAK